MITVFDDPIFIIRTLSSLNFDYVQENISGICSLFSDLMFLEAQIATTGDEKLYAAYDSLLFASRDLVDAVFLSEKRASRWDEDKKYSEHITFQWQNAHHDVAKEFWKVVKSSGVDMLDAWEIQRATLDTSFPLAISYIHILWEKRPLMKKLLQNFSQFAITLLTDEGEINLFEIFSSLDYSKKYTKKMMRRVPTSE